MCIHSILCMFAMVPDSRINSWVSWFIFNLRKISIISIMDQYPWMQEIIAQYVNAHNYKTTITHNYSTYLNSGLLEAPREDVLHGLVPGLNWAPIVASPYDHASCCHVQLGILLFLAMVQVSVYVYMYVCMYCIYIYIYTQLSRFRTSVNWQFSINLPQAFWIR